MEKTNHPNNVPNEQNFSQPETKKSLNPKIKSNLSGFSSFQDFEIIEPNNESFKLLKELGWYQIHVKTIDFSNQPIIKKAFKSHWIWNQVVKGGCYLYGAAKCKIYKEKEVKLTKEEFEKLKVDYCNKMMAFLPQNLSKSEIEKVRVKIIYSLSLLPFEDSAVLVKLLNWADLFSKMRQEQVQILKDKSWDPLDEDKYTLMKSIDTWNHCFDKGKNVMMSQVKLANALFDIRERVGPMNSQITEDSFWQAIYHPSHIASTESISKFQICGRELINWKKDSKIENLKELDEFQNATILVNEGYQLHSLSDCVYSKITWHMEEGVQLDEKERLFQSGYLQLSFAIPSTGDIRSCRIPIDLKPFGLKKQEHVLIALSMMKEINKKSRKAQIKSFNQCLDAIESLNSEKVDKPTLIQFMDEKFQTKETYEALQGILKNRQAFEKIALTFNEMSMEVLTKLLVSVGDPKVHFEGIEELGDHLPCEMIKKLCQGNKGFAGLWKDFSADLSKLRMMRANEYLGGGTFNLEHSLKLVNTLSINLNELTNLLEKRGLSENELHVIKKYIDELLMFANNPWNTGVSSQIKLMERMVEKTHELADGKEEKKILKKILLFPLSDREVLRGYGDLLRVLKVAREANQKLLKEKKKVTGEEFHNQRLKRKVHQFLGLVNTKLEIKNGQKESLVELVIKLSNHCSKGLYK